MKKLLVVYLAVITNLFCGAEQRKTEVATGLDRIDQYQDLFRGKRIGIVTNHTAYNSQDKHIIDIFSKMDGVEIRALFGPEHGIRGEEAAGHLIKDSLDPETGIPVYSLYGEIRKPTKKMLGDIDQLIFDIQDIGARFYTYIYTMALSMEAAAENNIPFIVLDRPNPINGIDVEGNILDTSFSSFVGLYPIPVRHGMTVGELALLINENGWLANGIRSNLTVIEMSGWQREMWFDQTGLTWRAPSPNMPDLNVATVYPGLCLFEGTNISEGRGTYEPFLRIGAPWLNVASFELINKILALPGVRFWPISFTPKSIIAMSPNPKHKDIKVFGVSVQVTDRTVFSPYLSGIALVKYFYDANPEKFEWRQHHFDRLCGTDLIRKFIIKGKPIEEIQRWMQEDQQKFIMSREQYLLY